MFMSPQNVYVETLPLNLMVLGDGTFGKQLGLDEATGMPPW